LFNHPVKHLSQKETLFMSAEKVQPATLEKSPWVAWRESISNPSPALVGNGKVVDIGLMYKLPNKPAADYAWDSSTSSLDKLQLELAERGARSVTRVYKFAVDANVFPGKQMTANAIATQIQGWPTRFNLGDEVELYAWREKSAKGEYTQVAFKRG
jgi:hypothetical protein